MELTLPELFFKIESIISVFLFSVTSNNLNYLFYPFQIRQTQYVGVWPVAFAGKAKLQGPICLNGSIVDWLNLYATTL